MNRLPAPHRPALDEVPKDWTISVSIDERESGTQATARLQWRNQEAVGVGLARLNPTDRYSAGIGDELAVARALSDLARRMMSGTVEHLEKITSLHGSPSGA